MKNSRQSFIIVLAILVIITGIILCLNTNNKSNPKDNTPIKSGDTIIEYTPELNDCEIEYDTKFGGAYIKITIEDFNQLGFEYGDSVSVDFSNGYSLKDIPYYNGYYVDYGDVLLVAYPGYPYIKLGINFGDDLWEIANLSETDTCTIKLNERAKYLDIQKVRDIHYTDEQGNIPNEVFANFRAMNVGELKENIIYRGASPIDNKHNRAPVVDKLLENENVSYIINLADNEEEIAEFKSGDDFNSPYFAKLLDKNKVVLLSMDANFKSDAFAEKLVRGLTEASKNDGPYYIHCQEGKDRTGYVCMIIEALTGATFEEIVDDYMKTYDNYYGITKEGDPERYELIKKQNIDEMVKYITGLDDIKDVETVDLRKCAEDYLVKIGMRQRSVAELRLKLEK